MARRFDRKQDMYFDQFTIDILARLVARMVEEVLTFKRTAGVGFPKEYDVGMRLQEDLTRPGTATVTIRVGPIRDKVVATWRGDGDSFYEAIYHTIVMMSNRWIAQDPALSADLARVDTAWLQKMERHDSEEEWRKIAKSARDARYQVVQGRPILPSEQMRCRNHQEVLAVQTDLHAVTAETEHVFTCLEIQQVPHTVLVGPARPCRDDLRPDRLVLRRHIRDVDPSLHLGWRDLTHQDSILEGFDRDHRGYLPRSLTLFPRK